MADKRIRQIRDDLADALNDLPTDLYKEALEELEADLEGWNMALEEDYDNEDN